MLPLSCQAVRESQCLSQMKGRNPPRIVLSFYRVKLGVDRRGMSEEQSSTQEPVRRFQSRTSSCQEEGGRTLTSKTTLFLIVLFQVLMHLKTIVFSYVYSLCL